MKADMHIHTNHSDGNLSVGEILDLAKYEGLSCISITDHDCVSALDEGIEYGKQIGVKVIPGIELSAYTNFEMHILGYNIDYKNPKLVCKLNDLLVKRRARKDKILLSLKGQGIILDPSNLPMVNVGRGHIAKEMLKQGYVATLAQAFEDYLGENKKAYFPSGRLSFEDALLLLQEYNAVSVIAHPVNMLRSGKLEKIVKQLKPLGLGGIEVYYPTATVKEITDLLEIADKYDLIVTGGSDYHGSYYKNETNFLGCCVCDVPKELLI